MVRKRKSVIILDDDLGDFKEPLRASGFKVLFPQQDAESREWESIDKDPVTWLAGRIFLTANPKRFEAKQDEWDFDMIVLPSSEVSPEVFSDTIEKWAESYDPVNKRACWRIDISESLSIKFKLLSEVRYFSLKSKARNGGVEVDVICEGTADWQVSSGTDVLRYVAIHAVNRDGVDIEADLDRGECDRLIAVMTAQVLKIGREGMKEYVGWRFMTDSVPLYFWIPMATRQIVMEEPPTEALPLRIEFKDGKVSVVVCNSENGPLPDWQLYLLRITWPDVMQEVIKRWPEVAEDAVTRARFINEHGERVM